MDGQKNVTHFFAPHFFAVVVWGHALPLLACPFCTALRPTLAQERDRAEIAFLGELIEPLGEGWKVRVHHPLKGLSKSEAARAVEVSPVAVEHLRPATLALVCGGRRTAKTPAKRSWTIVVLNEASYGYVAQSPALKMPVTERLSYFLRYLEHSDPLLADDAYLEFGHAPFDEITRLGGRLPVDRLRGWIDDESVPPERKGLYGLLLGAAARDQNRVEVADDFWRWIEAPNNDFRSGFDGILGGCLWVGKKAALERLEKRYLDGPRAAVGDLRHLMTALRFYHDYGGDITAAELAAVYRRFLDRPALAAAAAGDLARWQDWESLDRVGALFARPGYDDPTIERAVIGYLLACPLPAAIHQIARLRKLVPDRVAEAERLEASGPVSR